MPAPWTINNRPAANTAATATQAAPAGGLASNLQVRVRLISASLLATGAGAVTDQIVIRDGATVVGTIKATWDMGSPGNTATFFTSDELDYRATPGNGLTVEFVNGAANSQEAVNAEGDFVILGTEYGSN